MKSISCLYLPTVRSQVAIVSEKSTIFSFSYSKAFVSKVDLAVKYVKVTPMSSFEQFMMDWSPQCYIPSFVEIGLLVLEKKIFEGFLPYMGVAAILVMSPRCREQNFVPPIQGGSTYNLALIGQAVSEMKMSEHCGRRTTDKPYMNRTTCTLLNLNEPNPAYRCIVLPFPFHMPNPGVYPHSLGPTILNHLYITRTSPYSYSLHIYKMITVILP